MAPISLMKRSLGERWPPLAESALTAIRRALGEGAVEITMTALMTRGWRSSQIAEREDRIADEQSADFETKE